MKKKSLLKSIITFVLVAVMVTGVVPLPGSVLTARASDITQNTAVVINSSNKSTYEGKTITGTVPADSRAGEDTTFIKKAAIFVDGIELNLTIDGFNADYSSLYSCVSGISLANGATLHLTVKGTNTLKGGFGGAGIAVPAGCTLEITSASTGTLNATGGNAYGGGAGIGSIGNGQDTNKALGQLYPQGLGDIIINGGTINANGGTWKQYYDDAGGAAGIGSSESSGATDNEAASYGDHTYLNNITGSITINGGTVTATGGYGAAGIGGGTCGTVQTITISDGNVTATAGYRAAAIGLGCNNYVSASGGTLTCPTVTISGGTVEANGNIGYGEVIAYSQNTGGGVTISGNADVTCSGNVTAGSTDWKVRISFAANGGLGTMETVERNRGNYTLPQCAFTPPNGKAFYKWKIGENRYDPGQTISVQNKTQVIAEWIEAVTVSFEVGDGGTGTMASVPAGKGQAYVLPACHFTPNEGRIFLHWQLDDKTYRPWSSVTLTENTTFTAVWGNQADWTNTTVYIGGDMTYSNRIEVTGNVILDIAEGATLTVPAGIHVTGENNLTIQGKGSLIINGAVDSCAGIGGNNQESCGTVTIDGGTIDVVGFKTNSNGGAGIGGGKSGGGGTITINGGVIEATGGGSSAGIGGGSFGAGGSITINGGTINATGLGSAASIGAGQSGEGADIKITGGNITANKGIGATNGSVSLGWTNASDSITASSYKGTVSFADGKQFVLSDTGAEATTGNIAGKNIVPAVTVSVADLTNGTVSADKSLYAIGSTATLTIGPASGYVLDTLTVAKTGDSSTTIETAGTGNTRTFPVPAYDVTVTATFDTAPTSYDVSITAGTGMTKTAASGAASQTGLSGAMTAVIYTANAGYYFPTDYSVVTVNGIGVTRDSFMQITVSGTPTANATIALTDATAKTKPDAPNAPSATNCSTADNNDGKLTGITADMEYRVSTSDSWMTGTGSDITGLVPGIYYVRIKATETMLASDNQTLTIASYTAPGQVAAPTFNPAAGTYTDTQSVTISCGTDGADIYYTMDGATPTKNSTKYTGAIFISATTTIKAIAVKDGMTDSAVATAIYTIKTDPVITKAPAARTGLVYNGQPQVLITAGEVTGGTFYYALGNSAEAAQPYTTSIPTGTDAGTYYVWYKAKGNDTHSDSTPKCVPVKITSDSQPTPTPDPTPDPDPTPSSDPTPSDSDTSGDTGTTGTETTPQPETPAETRTETTTDESGNVTTTTTETKVEGDTTTVKETETITDASGKSIGVTETETATTTAGDTTTITETKTVMDESGTVVSKTETETVVDASKGTKTETTTTTTSEGTVQAKTVTDTATGASESVSVTTDASGRTTGVSTQNTDSTGWTTTADFQVSGDSIQLNNIETNNPSGEITIPSTIIGADGKTYTVTTIGSGAFGGSDTQKRNAGFPVRNASKKSGCIKVELPATITEIENNAFKGADIKKIILNTERAKDLHLSKKSFSNTNAKIVIHAKNEKQYNKLTQKILKSGGKGLRMAFKK